MVRGINTSRVVDCVSIDTPTGKRKLDATELGATQVSAFNKDLAAQLLAVDPKSVAGTVADLCMCFLTRLYIGSDSAVVDQVDGAFRIALINSVGVIVSAVLASTALTSAVSEIDLALRA